MCTVRQWRRTYPDGKEETVEERSYCSSASRREGQYCDLVKREDLGIERVRYDEPEPSSRTSSRPSIVSRGSASRSNRNSKEYEIDKVQFNFPIPFTSKQGEKRRPKHALLLRDKEQDDDNDDGLYYTREELPEAPSPPRLQIRNIRPLTIMARNPADDYRVSLITPHSESRSLMIPGPRTPMTPKSGGNKDSRRDSFFASSSSRSPDVRSQGSDRNGKSRAPRERTTKYHDDKHSVVRVSKYMYVGDLPQPSPSAIGQQTTDRARMSDIERDRLQSELDRETQIRVEEYINTSSTRVSPSLRDDRSDRSESTKKEGKRRSKG